MCAWARPVRAAVTLAVVVLRLGAGPFLDGVRALDGRVLAAAAGIGLVTTVCCAWRWTIVARGLGIGLGLPTAVAAYYRSLFLNVTLPGGVVGDVHGRVSHGRDAATSAAVCGPWPGNAPAGRSCRSSSPLLSCWRCRRPCGRRCRWWRSRWSRR